METATISLQLNFVPLITKMAVSGIYTNKRTSVLAKCLKSTKTSDDKNKYEYFLLRVVFFTTYKAVNPTKADI